MSTVLIPSGNAKLDIHAYDIYNALSNSFSKFGRHVK